jgi:hypothetical protein
MSTDPQIYAIAVFGDCKVILWYVTSGYGYYRAAVLGYYNAIPSPPRLAAGRDAAVLDAVEWWESHRRPELPKNFAPEGWVEVPVDEV